uniref:Uncharacterized protein n=1 Tax=Globodera rostochiensis TaxID=31243 RepID=A0A914HYR9_GLORO
MKLVFQFILFVLIVCLASGMFKRNKKKSETTTGPNSVNQNHEENVPKSKYDGRTERQKKIDEHRQYCRSKGRSECEKQKQYEKRRYM